MAIKPGADYSGGDRLEDFGDIGDYSRAQPKNHRLFTRIPSTRELGEREIVFAVVAGVNKIITKINGRMFYADLTGV